MTGVSSNGSAVHEQEWGAVHHIFDTFLKAQSVNTDCLLHSLFLFYTMSFLESNFDPLSEIKYEDI